MQESVTKDDQPGGSSTTFLELVSCSVRRAFSSLGSVRLAVSLADRLRYRLAYLRIFWCEICNVRRRMEILRNANLIRGGVPIQQPQDVRLFEYQMPGTWPQARMRGIRVLRAIHPRASPIDLYLAVSIVGPALFDDRICRAVRRHLKRNRLLNK